MKHILMELWFVDMGKVIVHLCIKPDKNRKIYGLIPKMPASSRGNIAAVPASSFPERINSIGNQVLTKGNSVLGLNEINMVAVLRMNREYMKYMRQKHPEASQQHFNMTVLKLDNNNTDEEDPESDEEPEEEPKKERARGGGEGGGAQLRVR